MKNYRYNNNIKLGDVRFNKVKQHPSLIVGDKINVYPVVNITHSKSTKGKSNLKINNRSFVVPVIDFVSENNIENISNNEVFTNSEKDKILYYIRQNIIKPVDVINLRKIK